MIRMGRGWARVGFVAVLFRTINLAVDPLYRYLDPQIRYAG